MTVPIVDILKTLRTAIFHPGVSIRRHKHVFTKDDAWWTSSYFVQQNLSFAFGFNWIVKKHVLTFISLTLLIAC